MTAVAKDYPGELNIIAYQTGTFKKTFTWRIAGVAVNVTGFTATFAIRSGTTTVASVTSTAGIVLGGAAGTIAVTIADDVMATVAVGSYGHELTLISAGGETTPLLAGSFVVDRV